MKRSNQKNQYQKIAELLKKAIPNVTLHAIWLPDSEGAPYEHEMLEFSATQDGIAVQADNDSVALTVAIDNLDSEELKRYIYGSLIGKTDSLEFGNLILANTFDSAYAQAEKTLYRLNDTPTASEEIQLMSDQLKGETPPMSDEEKHQTVEEFLKD
jgi:hypothetical protein